MDQPRYSPLPVKMEESYPASQLGRSGYAAYTSPPTSTAGPMGAPGLTLPTIAESLLQPTETKFQAYGTAEEGGESGKRKAMTDLLTEEEKKANHIASEHKRRKSIRTGFQTLTEVVPNLSRCSRSEALILQKTVEYIHQLTERRNELHSRVRLMRRDLGEGPSMRDMTRDSM